MSVSVISGASSDILTVDATSKAARVTAYDAAGDVAHPAKAWPVTLGSYSLHMKSGLLAAGAQSATDMFQFRWRDATRLCVLSRINISFSPVTAYAAGQLSIDAIVQRSFSAVGSGTGSSTATLSTNNSNKKKTSFGSSLVNDADIVIMGTAVLSAGTKTADNHPFAGITHNAITPTSSAPYLLGHNLWNRDSQFRFPLVFAQNEGFSVRITCPGTGTCYFGITVEWDEMTTTEL